MPRANKDDKVFLKRHKKHQTELNRLMKSVNVYDNRKVLVEFISIMLDGDADTLRPFMMEFIRANFIDKRGTIRWQANDGTEIDDKTTKSDQEVKDNMTAMLKEFLKGE